MIGRFTEQARRTIFWARHIASEHGSSTIETEHFLLGMFTEGKNTFHRFFLDKTEDLRESIEKRIERKEKTGSSIDIPLSAECKRILQHAVDESERLGHRHIGMEHLLLGILREEKCRAVVLLTEFGIDLEQIRQAFPTPEPRVATPESFEDGVRQRLERIETLLVEIHKKLSKDDVS